MPGRCGAASSGAVRHRAPNVSRRPGQRGGGASQGSVERRVNAREGECEEGLVGELFLVTEEFDLLRRLLRQENWERESVTTE